MKQGLDVAAPISTTTSPPSPGGIGYTCVDASSRLSAFLIDTILLAVLLFASSLGASALFGPAFVVPAGEGGTVEAGRLLVEALFGTVVSGGYFVLAWTRLRGSPGQRLLGMRIGDARDGAPLTAGRAAARWVLLGAPLWIAAVSAPGLVGAAAAWTAVGWSLVLLVTTARSETKQGLHDRATRVIVARPARAVLWSDAGLEQEGPDVH